MKTKEIEFFTTSGITQMKLKYVSILAASLLITMPAFAVRERCGTQRPNISFYPTTPARTTVGSALQVPFPTVFTFAAPVRTAAWDPIYRPGGGVSCEKTQVSTGTLNGLSFGSVGYYEYPLYSSLNPFYSGVRVELQVPSYNDNLNNNIPIKFTEFVFGDGRSLSLYMMSTEAKESIPGIKNNIVIYGEFGDSSNSGTRRKILALTSLPYTNSGIFRDYDIQLNWTVNTLTLSTYGYSTYLDPNPYDTTPYLLATSRVDLFRPPQVLNLIRIGSIEKTDAFIDGPSMKPVFSIESVRWINAQ
jgi:hypothetical protein